MLAAVSAQANTLSAITEPKSFADFIGREPNPKWEKPEDRVKPFGISNSLPYVEFADQPHTNSVQTPNPCSKYFGVTPEVIDVISVTPTSGIIGIGWSAQGSLPEGNGFAGMAMTCNVTQSGVTRYCSGVVGEPLIMQRPKQSQTAPVNAWRSSTVNFTGYHGYVSGLIPNEPATVTITARVFSQPAGATGQVCYGILEVSY